MAVGTNATTLSSLDTQGILPKPLVGEIIKKVSEDSVIQRVAGTTPVTITGNTVATQTGDIVAGIVGEGEAVSHTTKVASIVGSSSRSTSHSGL